MWCVMIRVWLFIWCRLILLFVYVFVGYFIVFVCVKFVLIVFLLLVILFDLKLVWNVLCCWWFMLIEVLNFLFLEIKL